MQMRQGDVASAESASFLSKVENGVAAPSLDTLRDWSNTLQTTAGDLLGDHLLLEAAKHCVLLTEQCHRYLDQLRPSSVTLFLRELSTSATSLSVSVPNAPADPELEYLTTQVLWHRGMVEEAMKQAEKNLSLIHAPLLRIRYLSLLCLIYDELDEENKKRKSIDTLRSSLQELDHATLLHQLPEADALRSSDLDLLTLSSLAYTRDLL
jgi:transcriptional regulator with XRE-family HTH domain